MAKLSELEKQQLRAVALPIWKNIIESSRNQDYAAFSRGFCNDLKSKLSEAHFRQSCIDFPLLTTIADDYEIIGSVRREKGITILWRLTSTEYAGEFLGILTLHRGAAGIEITGVSVN